MNITAPAVLATVSSSIYIADMATLARTMFALKRQNVLTPNWASMLRKHAMIWM